MFAISRKVLVIKNEVLGSYPVSLCTKYNAKTQDRIVKNLCPSLLKWGKYNAILYIHVLAGMSKEVFNLFGTY